MIGLVRSIRPGERRHVAVAVLTVFALGSSHAVLGGRHAGRLRAGLRLRQERDAATGRRAPRGARRPARRPDHPPYVGLGTWREHEPTLVERLLVMDRSPLFAGASLDAAIEILRHAVGVRHPAGAILWRVGDPSTFTLRIDYGRVRCTNAAGRSVDVGAGFMTGPVCSAELAAVLSR